MNVRAVLNSPEGQFIDETQGVTGHLTKAGRNHFLEDADGTALLIKFWGITPPPEGNLIQCLGKGIKRGAYKGKAEITVNEKTEITIMGSVKSVNPPAETPPGRASYGTPPPGHTPAYDQNGHYMGTAPAYDDQGRPYAYPPAEASPPGYAAGYPPAHQAPSHAPAMTPPVRPSWLPPVWKVETMRLAAYWAHCHRICSDAAFPPPAQDPQTQMNDEMFVNMVRSVYIDGIKDGYHLDLKLKCECPPRDPEHTVVMDESQAPAPAKEMPPPGTAAWSEVDEDVPF